MRITVYTGRGAPFFMAAPTRLIGAALRSRLLIRLLAHAKKEEGQPPPVWEQLLSGPVLPQLLDGLGRDLCRFRGLTITEVHSADGVYVKITL